MIKIVSLCAVFSPEINTYTPQMVEEEERICAVEMMSDIPVPYILFYVQQIE